MVKGLNINKTTSGKELHLNWNEIKRIDITKIADTNNIHFVFSNKKRVVPFDNARRVGCTLGVFSSKTHLSEGATSLILKKIDLYKIPVKAEKGLLEELSKKSNESLQRQSGPKIPHTKVRKRFPAKPSSSQTHTPK